MIGPIGVYYIYQLDIHPIYKEAFSRTLWWLYKLRRRYVNKTSVSTDSKQFNLLKEGRERLAYLECLMPRHFNTIVMHLCQHICSVLFRTGPPHSTWMFVFERYVQIIKGSLHSGFSAAEGIMRAIMTHEFLLRYTYTTTKDLDELITPPPDHVHYKRIIELIQPSKLITLRYTGI